MNFTDVIINFFKKNTMMVWFGENTKYREDQGLAGVLWKSNIVTALDRIVLLIFTYLIAWLQIPSLKV